MSISRYSQGALRDVPRSRYEHQDSAMFRAQRTRDNFSDLRTLDVDASLHYSPVQRERKYRSSQMLDYSSSRSSRDDASMYSETTAYRPLSPLQLVPLDTKRRSERKSKAHSESVRAHKSLAEETSTVSRLRTPKTSENFKLLSSQKAREKVVRFNDEVYLDAGSSDRLAGIVEHPRDALRLQSEDYLMRAPGNGNGEFRPHVGYSKTLPKRSPADERQRSYVPSAPIIPRLPTPEFDSACPCELGLTKYGFCACCVSDDRGEEGDVRRERRKNKMDKQVDNARAYISRMTMNKRLIER